jgi:acyl-CoA thioesterase I
MAFFRASLFGALIGMATVYAQSPPAPSRFIQNLDAGKAQIIVTYGTSLTAGGAWVGLLSAYLRERYPGKATLFNEGASSRSSQFGVKSIHNVTRHRPDLVLIEFAMNDAYYPARDGYTEGMTVDSSKANLKHIIDSVMAVNPACEVYLQTMDLPLGIHLERRARLLAYYQGYRDFAAAAGLPVIDHEPKWKALLDFDKAWYGEWVPDSIHPGAEGSGAITSPGVLSALTGMTIAWQSPLAGAAMNPGTDIELRAEASAGATRADFYDGKVKLGSDTSYPYAFLWKGAKLGKHLLTARLMRKETAVALTDLRSIEIKAVTALGADGKGPAGKSGLLAARVPFASARRNPAFWLGGTARRGPALKAILPGKAGP